MKYANLDIPDVDFLAASQAVVASVSITYPMMVQDSAAVEKILRSYVKLASSKEIDDWGTSINLRDAIAGKISSDLSELFGFIPGPPVQQIQADLDALISLAATGLVSQYIGYPSKWESQLESALASSSADTEAQHPGGILGSIESGIGSAIGGTIKQIFSELGLPLTIVIVLLVVFVIYLKLK